MCGPSFRASVEDDERSNRPSTSKTDENVDKIKQMMAENRKLIIGEMAANPFKTFCLMIWVRVKQFAKKDRICENDVTRGRTMPSLSATF